MRSRRRIQNSKLLLGCCGLWAMPARRPANFEAPASDALELLHLTKLVEHVLPWLLCTQEL